MVKLVVVESVQEEVPLGVGAAAVLHVVVDSAQDQEVVQQEEAAEILLPKVQGTGIDSHMRAERLETVEDMEHAREAESAAL